MRVLTAPIRSNSSKRTPAVVKSNDNIFYRYKARSNKESSNDNQMSNSSRKSSSKKSSSMDNEDATGGCSNSTAEQSVIVPGRDDGLTAELATIGIELDSPVVNPEGFCEINAIEMQVIDSLLKTPVSRIDSFLMQPGGVDAVGPLQSTMSLFESRFNAIVGSELPMPSDRDILVALMLPDSFQDSLDQRLLQTDPEDWECAVRICDFISQFVGVILVVLSVFSGKAVARIAVQKILQQLLRRNSGMVSRLAAVPFGIAANVDNFTHMFVVFVKTISLDRFFFYLEDSMTASDWGFVVAMLLLDVGLIVAAGIPTAGAGSAAVVGLRIARFARAAITAIQATVAYNAAVEACNDTSEPTQSPTSAPSSSSTPEGDDGWTSGVFGDPHVATFDGMRFDCQAAGEFVMVRSLENPNGLNIQERFTKVASSSICSQASVSTGIAIAEEQVPTIQLSIPRGQATNATSGTLNNCPLDLFVDGARVSLPANQFGSISPVSDVEISIDTPSSIAINYPFSGLRVAATVRNSERSFGCFLMVHVFIPRHFVSPDQTLIGLLGKPNFDRNDDWVDQFGNSYPGPANEKESVFGAAYDYCVSNWCVRSEADSIFTYREDNGESFASVFGCDNAYSGQELESQIDSANAEIVDLCAGNIICLIDGICGTLDDAVAVLQDENKVVASQQTISSSPTEVLLPFGYIADDNITAVPGFNAALDTPNGSRIVLSAEGYVMILHDSITTDPFVIAAFWIQKVSIQDFQVSTTSNFHGVGYLRQSFDGDDIRVGEEIVRQFDGSFSAEYAIVASWIQFLHGDFSTTGAQNIFQLVIVYGGNSAWAILSYRTLGFWGFLATSGFNNGSSHHSWFEILQASELQELLTGTNCGRPGTHAFELI